MMARMTPVSLHFSDVPTGWEKIFTDKQQLATGFACSSRTVSPDEHCYRLICASCTQFHVPLGTQAFQLPQAASKQRSVPWCCRCGMFAAFTTAAIRLLRSIFIWAPPRTRPKFQHLCAHTRDSQRSRCSARRCNISRLPLSSKHVLCFWLFFWYISDDDDESVVLSRSWPLPSQQRLAEMSSYRLTRLDRRVLGWHRSKYRWWCLPPSNDTFSSKQLANQLLPDSVRFLVAKNILEPIPSSQAQMKECVVEFVHQRQPPLHGFPPHSLHGLSGRTHLHPQILYATCLCTKILFVVNCCHVQRCGRCRRVSFNTKTHNRLASSLASSFENRM